MEEINKYDKNNLYNSLTNPKKNLFIEKYNRYDHKDISNNKKPIELNTITSYNDIRKKQRQIKQCFLDISNTKLKKEKNLQKKKIRIFKGIENDEKENISKNISKDINKSEIKTIKYDNKTKNIEINKIKIGNINLDTAANTKSITKRDFYKNPYENKNKNKIIEEPNIINKYISNFYNSKKQKITSFKGFNKAFYDKDLLNKENYNVEHFKLINPYNINRLLNENYYNNRYTISEKILYNNTNNNSIEKTKISFKNIKSFYAHLEIFLSLYLKRKFKYFIKIVKKYEKSNINNNVEQFTNERTNINNYGPIFNLNNSHCSLYYSININENKLYNTIIDNRNISSITNNNNIIPLNKNVEIENNKKLQSGRNNSNSISIRHNININKNKNIDEAYNASLYIPKKNISKNNSIIMKGIKANKNTICVKTSPIRVMNINLKKINVCRLNDLNKLYLNKIQNLYKKDSNKNNFNEINSSININNSLSNHVRYTSNNILSLNYNDNNSNNSNISKQKNKIKRIKTDKNDLYIKSKYKIAKKKIKEIIINKISPIKKENNNLKTENLLSSNNSFNRSKLINDNSIILNENLKTINVNKEVEPIKNIYIKTISQEKKEKILNLNKNNFDSYKKYFYSTFLGFKKNRINNNEILIKQIITSDKKIYISIKYVKYISNYFNKKEKSYKNLKIDNENCLSIINNNIYDNYNNLLNRFNNLKIQDKYFFDNENKGNNNIINLDNISFSFKDYFPTKEENIDNRIIKEKMLDFINSLKKVITKFIWKYLFTEDRKRKYIIKLLNNKNNKIINFYFMKLKGNINRKQKKRDKKNELIYHKINYNDDFNYNKRLKTQKNNLIDGNANVHCKVKAYNLSLQNSINQIKIKKNK